MLNVIEAIVTTSLDGSSAETRHTAAHCWRVVTMMPGTLPSICRSISAIVSAAFTKAAFGAALEPRISVRVRRQGCG